MRIKLTREMIKRIYDGNNKGQFKYCYADDAHLIIMLDNAYLMIVDATDEWNDLISGLNIDPDDRLDALRIRLTSDVEISNIIKFKNDAFIRGSVYWKLSQGDDMYLFDDKYMKYFIKNKMLSYDLFISGHAYGIIAYEGDPDDGYSICGVVMGVKFNG